MRQMRVQGEMLQFEKNLTTSNHGAFNFLKKFIRSYISCPACQSLSSGTVRTTPSIAILKNRALIEGRQWRAGMGLKRLTM